MIFQLNKCCFHILTQFFLCKVQRTHIQLWFCSMLLFKYCVCILPGIMTHALFHLNSTQLSRTIAIISISRSKEQKLGMCKKLAQVNTIEYAENPNYVNLIPLCMYFTLCCLWTMIKSTFIQREVNRLWSELGICFCKWSFAGLTPFVYQWSCTTNNRVRGCNNNTGPTKSKILTAWPLVGNICRPLVWSSGS
jgi:hypothetical protein